MPKRGENIHKRKDGRWEGRLKIGKHPNGTTKYKSVYAKTYSEVKEKLNQARHSGFEPEKGKHGNSLFSEVMSAWFTSAKFAMKGSTVYKYTYLMERHINPELGAIRVCDITSSLIGIFTEQKLRRGKLDGSGGLSSFYVKTMLYIIQAVMAFACDEGLCPPLRTKITMPAERRKDIAILSLEEQRRFERYVVHKTGTTELGMLISLYAGLRIGEVCALKWEDVDLKKGVILIRHTISRIKCEDNEDGRRSRLILDSPKTDASKRDIPISSLLMPHLVKARDTACSSYVVSDRPGFLNPRTFAYRYHKVLGKCGLSIINYHALRHTFATRCIEAGVDIKSLSEILGHANISITLNTYVHSSMEMKRTQLEKLSLLSACE